MAIINLIVDSRFTAAKPLLKTAVSVDDMEKTLLDIIREEVVLTVAEKRSAINKAESY